MLSKVKQFISSNITTIIRWLDLLFLTIIALIICIFLYPLFNFCNAMISKYLWRFHTTFLIFMFVATIIILWLIIIKIGGFRINDFHKNNTFFYPPIWIFAFINVVIYLLIIPKLYLETKINIYNLDFEYLLIYIGIVLLGMLIASFFNSISSTKNKSILKGKHTDIEIGKITNILNNSEFLIDWIQKEDPISEPTEDLFNMTILSKRIVRILSEIPLKTIGIVGIYGSGKSCIINLIRYCLNSHYNSNNYLSEWENKRLIENKDIITCTISGWGLRKGTAIEHILKIAINEIARYVDCTGLFYIPSYYYSAISNTGSAWSKIIGSLLNATSNPIKMLIKLDKVLGCINKRLIIFLEDLDRNKEDEVFIDEIAILLDNLKKLENVSFVIAISPDLKIFNILLRISEHIESIPTLPREYVVELINAFRNHCINKFSNDISCSSEKERDKRLGIKLNNEIIDLIGRGTNEPIDAITKLLITPRLLKKSLLRTWHAWGSLHGELDFDDLLVANTLRFGAPESFAFLDQNIIEIRDLMTSLSFPKDSKENKFNKLESKWNELKNSAKWDFDAAKELKGFLFPALRHVSLTSSVLQSVGSIYSSDYPVDYWGRLNAEEIPDVEIRDQEILHSIEQWKRTNFSKVYNNLTLSEAIFEINGFAKRIYYFGKFFSGEQVRILSSNLFALILEDKKSKANKDNCPGFYELSNLSFGNPIDSHDCWILDEIYKSLSISLNFSYDLYLEYCDIYFNRIQPDPGLKKVINTKIVNKAKELFEENIDRLINAIDQDFMDNFKLFGAIFMSSLLDTKNLIREDWNWLSDVLLKAGQENPQIIIPQIIPLVINSNFVGRGKYDYTFKYEIANSLFEKNLKGVMKLLTEEIDITRFDEFLKSIIEFAKKEANKWLSQNESTR